MQQILITIKQEKGGVRVKAMRRRALMSSENERTMAGLVADFIKIGVESVQNTFGKKKPHAKTNRHG